MSLSKAERRRTRIARMPAQVERSAQQLADWTSAIFTMRRYPRLPDGLRLELIGRSFPSATVQPAGALYEGKRRSILMARIRTDSTEAVIELAQRLCIAFNQQFVGIEVGGRYIRIYGDDTD